jgi:hypothetical protein
MAFAAILPTPVLAANVAFVQSWDIGRDDATLIIEGLFDVNVKLHEIGEDVVAIREVARGGRWRRRGRRGLA